MEKFIMAHIPGMVKAKEEVIGRTVKNIQDDNLGEIKELVLDKISGVVAYAVLESGSFLGLGGKLFAIPWNSLEYDRSNECFRLNIDKERIKNAPGFDKDHWPDMSNKTWGKSVFEYYGTKAYWE